MKRFVIIIRGPVEGISGKIAWQMREKLSKSELG